jgi:uncharacterized protein (TIGR03437 family)
LVAAFLWQVSPGDSLLIRSDTPLSAGPPEVIASKRTPEGESFALRKERERRISRGSPSEEDKMRGTDRIHFCIRVLAAIGVFVLPQLAAETPLISSVFRDAIFPAKELSPGARAWVAVESLGTPQPGTVAVEVGGRPAPVLADLLQEDNSLIIQIPVELAPGPTTLVLIVDDVRSPAFDIQLNPFSPGFYHYSRFSRLTRFSEDGKISCWPGETVAPGDIVRARAIGLGITNPIVPTGDPAPEVPLASTVMMPVVTVAGQPAEVLESVLEPGQIGLYRVAFRVPEMEARGWQTVVLRIGDYEVKQDIPIGLGLTTTALGQNVTTGAAPEAIVFGISCGGLLAEADITADSRNPPDALGGVTIRIEDSAGIERPSPILRAQGEQIWYVIPTGTATGTAILTATSANGTVFHETLEIQSAVPGIAGVRFWGDGLPAAMLVRVRDGVQSIEPVVETDAFGNPVLVLIDMGPETDELYLMLFGTGIRFRSSLENVSLKIGAETTAVEYAGPQGEFAGLDQVNAKLPRSLAGSGLVPIELTVDGEAANVTFLYFQ